MKIRPLIGKNADRWKPRDSWEAIALHGAAMMRIRFGPQFETPADWLLLTGVEEIMNILYWEVAIEIRGSRNYGLRL
jgi:hypothetical protein